MVIFLLVPSFTDRSFLNDQVIFIDYRSDGTVSSPCFNDMKDHLIAGQLIRWLIIIHSSGIAINVMLSMSRIIIISSSSSHRFHPYRYIVNLVMIASNQSANSQILQSWYKVTSSSSPSCIINILKRLIDRCCTVFTKVTCHRAIAASLVQDKLLFSKEGQGFDSWIWFHKFHYTS